MRTPILLITLLFSVQNSGINNNEKDFTSEIKTYDISYLFTLETFYIEDDTFIIERPQPLGFIGDDFQRFNIRFISVIKNSTNPMEYFVYGKSKVKNNICSFQGTLTLNESKIYESNEDPSLKEGYATGTYEFYEDPYENGSGIFKGKFSTNFYITKNNYLKYNILNWGADNYVNNQFEGQWVSYKTGNAKKCNWGDYRIPDCGDLDVGAGEFIPADKYKDFGWANYQLSLGQSSNEAEVTEALNKEHEKWWLK